MKKLDLILPRGTLEGLEFITSVTGESPSAIIVRLITSETKLLNERVHAFHAKHPPHDPS